MSKMCVCTDDLKDEGLDFEQVDLGIADISCACTDLGTTNMATGYRGLSAYDIAKKHGFTGTEAEFVDSFQLGLKIVKDKVLEDTYNLVDKRGNVYGSFTDTYVENIVYDAILKQITFFYNKASGKAPISSPFEVKPILLSKGLMEYADGVGIKIDEESHEALSVSEKGLRLDGSYFADSDEALFVKEDGLDIEVDDDSVLKTLLV